MKTIKFDSQFHKDHSVTIDEGVIKHNLNSLLKKRFKKDIGEKHYDRLKKSFDEYFKELLNLSQDSSTKILLEFRDVLLYHFLSDAFIKLYKLKNSLKKVNKSDPDISERDIQGIIGSEIVRIIHERFFFASLLVSSYYGTTENMVKIKESKEVVSKSHRLTKEEEEEKINGTIQIYLNGKKPNGKLHTERSACIVAHKRFISDRERKGDLGAYTANFRKLIAESFRQNNPLIGQYFLEREKRKKK